MKLSPEIPQSIAEEYFVLHDAIKNITRLYTFESFNSKTFENESKRSSASKKPFYILSTLSIGFLCYSIFSVVNTLEVLQYMPEPPALETEEKLKETSSKLAVLITLNLLGGTIFLGYKALQVGDIFYRDVKSRLLVDAHHPGIAKQTYEAVENILKLKIPVFVNLNGRIKKLPIHDRSGPRKNAMLVLLGNESHRQALWKDQTIPSGKIIVKKTDFDKVLGDLKQSIDANEKASESEHDSRAVITAFLYKHHLQTCFDVMDSDYFWADMYRNGNRKSRKRDLAKAISDILLKNWKTWVEFQKEIIKNFNTGSERRVEFDKFRDKLFATNDRNTDELIGIFAGDDRSINPYFFKLRAISHNDLVERGTSLL